MNLQKANFENMLDAYYQSTSAHKAAEYIGRLIQLKQQQQLTNLLQDYRERPIPSSSEVGKLRAATNRLLKCCSVMEIASLTGFIPDLQKTEFGSKMHTILSNEIVRRYYEEFYPEKLPQLFLLRLEGTNHEREEIDPDHLNRTIIVFLDLDRRFMETLDGGYLLRMLDSSIINGCQFSDVVNLIGEQDEFIDHLLNPSQNNDLLSNSLKEFSLLMQFCFDMRKLLLQIESYPLTQSAIWNIYSYWFGIIGDKVRGQLGEALSQFLVWKPAGDGSDAVTADKAVQDYVTEAHIVLKTLTSQKFAGPLDGLLKKQMGLVSE